MSAKLFLSKASAFLKRNFKEAASYPFSFFFDFSATVVSLLIFFFIGKLMGHQAKSYLEPYEGDYFSFVLTGIAFLGFQTAALSSFGRALGREQSAGTLEAIWMTGTSFWTLMLTELFWVSLGTAGQTFVYLLLGKLILGVRMGVSNIFSVVFIVFLTLTSLSGVGIASAGFALAFKRGDPFQLYLNSASKFFSGLYFPITILPLWAQKFSFLFPLTYSLQGLRRILLNDAPLSSLKTEIVALGLFSVFLIPASVFYFQWAVGRARRDGSLTFQ